MTGTLDDLAAAYGIAVTYEGLDGSEHTVPDQTKIGILAAMGVAADTEDALEQALAEAPHPSAEAMEPQQGVRCFWPDWLGGQQTTWGIALQLYALRSARNWGIGDFADLARFVVVAAGAGADFVGINPLHAMFASDPERRSPFFPSNRRFLNPLYIAADEVPCFSAAMVDEAAIEAARAPDLVDYRAVAVLKFGTLWRLWPVWCDALGLPAEYSHAAFEAFRREGGEPLRRHALFEALSVDRVSKGEGSGWTSWPEEFHAVDGDAVVRFAETGADDVAFHAWLQWLASVQLTHVAGVARTNGMRIGLYLDFAVGEAPDGSATWGAPASTMRGVRVGAPPDYFSTHGQDWGLAPLSPATLMASENAAYRDMVRASMRYAGALRIDHAMGLRQLFLIPDGCSPAQGSYVRYPIGRMLGDVASASQEHRTIIVGEDLGNVPRGFRDVMREATILSYRILYFERHAGGFAMPGAYPRDALACLSTHDLPTIAGWWRGEDIRLRRDHHLISGEAADAQALERDLERRQLGLLLKALGLLSEEEADRAARAAIVGEAPLPPELVVAIHRFIARTPSSLLAARIEDLGGEEEPVNLPGTVDGYPNWKRKLVLPLEEIGDSALFRSVTEALRAERPRRG